ALGGDTLVAHAGGRLEPAVALEVGELGPALPQPGVGAAGGAAADVAVDELAVLGEVRVTHALGRLLAEVTQLLGGEPGPGVVAAADPARHLLVLHGAEQRRGERRGGVAPAIGAARRAASVVTSV